MMGLPSFQPSFAVFRGFQRFFSSAHRVLPRSSTPISLDPRCYLVLPSFRLHRTGLADKVTLEPVFNVVNAVDFAPELSIDSFNRRWGTLSLKVKAEAEVSGSGESAEVSPLRPPERSSAPQLSCTSSSAILKRSQITVASISSPSITVRMSFMTFYWVLLGFTGFYRVFLGSADSQTMTIAQNAT